MAKEKTIELADLQFDDKNANKHTDEGLQLLEKSITENKFGRSILLDKDGRIIADNGVVESAKKLGHQKVRVIETEGDELIAVQRKDLSLDSKEGRSLAIADNSIAAKDLEWDEDNLKAISEEWDVDLNSWGVDILEEERKEKETEKLSSLEYESVYYEPTKTPNIMLEDCYDLTKFNAKKKIIEESDISEEKKAILMMFAYRFIKIDFESVANYYAFCATEKEKEIIERLRLVLIDGGVNGFIEDDLLKIVDVE